MIIIKIALCGYKGKTGSKVYEVLKENNFEIYTIDKEDSLIDVIEKVDFVIDFTNKETALKHICLCVEYKKPFICGTTGFNSNELANIKSLCSLNKIKGVICYNFSIPLNYILNSIDFFKKYYAEFTYLDVHHISKIDRVSGTTYLFLLKNNKFKVKSIKTNKNVITYIIQMSSKYDKMIITYQVYDKKAFGIGVMNYLLTKDETSINNLIG